MNDYQHHPKWFFIKGGTTYTCKCAQCNKPDLLAYQRYLGQQPIAGPVSPSPYITWTSSVSNT